MVVELTCTTELFLEEPEDIAHYGRVVPDLLEIALSTEESLALIASAARSLDSKVGRDDQNTSGPMLTFPRQAWAAAANTLWKSTRSWPGPS